MPRLAVMMVEPRYGLNIGYVARTMMNFGVKDLLITGIKEIPRSAYKFASHASDVVKNARLVKFNEGIKEFDYRIATSARSNLGWKRPIRRAITPEEAFQRALKHQDILIILGRDTTGLTNEEIAACDELVRIPTDEGYPAMNISHSLAVLLYLWFRSIKEIEVKKSPIKREEVDALESYIKSVIAWLNYDWNKEFRIIKLFKEISLDKLNDERDMLTLLGFFRDLSSSLSHMSNPSPKET